jgi:hypothetical protein
VVIAAILASVKLVSGAEHFTTDDFQELSNLVVESWTEGADRDWTVPAGTVEWTCTKTADHAVDCVYAPAVLLASRRLDAYPEVGIDRRSSSTKQWARGLLKGPRDGACCTVSFAADMT